MKKKIVIIILVVQTALMLYSFIYGYVQEGIAKEQEILINENAKFAIEERKKSSEMMAKFEREYNRLNGRIAELEGQLSNCKKK